MKTELMLKLQSWVDGELPESEARQIAELVRTDKEAAALAEELRVTRSFLTGNEPEAKLPESHEFHWSKIQRAIERAEAEVPAREAVPWLEAVRRFLVPVSGVALVLFLTVVSIGVFDDRKPAPTGDDPMSQLVEEQTLSTHVDTTSYRTKAENMFVVYIVNKDGEGDEEDADADIDWEEEMDVPVIQ